MKNFRLIHAAVAALLLVCQTGADESQGLLRIERGVELAWATASGNTYQAQWSIAPGGPWTDIGGPLPGDGTAHALYDSAAQGSRFYQVIELIPGSDPVSSSPVNGGFELGNGTTADHWSATASQVPVRSNSEAHSGIFSIRSALNNTGNASSEGNLSQLIVAEGGTVTPGQAYAFSFWAKQISSGASYVQQYQVEWRNASNAVIGGTGLVDFNGVIGSWVKISATNLLAPASAVEARIRFRFVTGAIAGAHGEVFIDDVLLDSGGATSPGTLPVTNVLEPTIKPVAKISWPSISGVTYQPFSTTDFTMWTPIPPAITGDGGMKEITVETIASAEFFRLEMPSEDSGFVALYNVSTPLEPAITMDTPEARVTRVGDRARDRHAREGMFSAYDHYLSWYWEERTIDLEIIDRVAKGGNSITFNYKTLTPLGQPEFRAFYRGIGTVAEYHFNLLAPLTGPNQYSATLTSKLPENRPLQLGDRVEIEISQFIQAPLHGRNNYYGTAILYIVGQGIVPWQAQGPLQDSFPLPENAWLGGHTTLPYQYSNEPEHRYKQTAGNISPFNIQPFMLGRRLHHTDFGNGTHSESGNPVFSEHIGKLGPKFIARSCVECHTNNGRALPPAIGAPMLQSVVKVGLDASGAPHPVLGSVLQPQAVGTAVEGVATILNYLTNSGQYDDGNAYSLRKPVYAFTGTTPSHFSVRIAPPLVGLGLLESVAETTITSMADADDANQDGISGRAQTLIDPETGDLRLGRFTGKSGQARLSHQIAAALNTDMGVRTAVFPTLDGESSAGTPEISAAELDQMTRYIALLGVGARRDLTNTQALRGEQLFTTAQCAKCHTPELATSPHHPLAELRNQTIRPFTDLLLHDMGSGLADNMGEHGASGSEWRTPPLWGIGLSAGVSGGEAYLHDGRARTLEEAILWHGGEAEASKETFRTMPAADRAALIVFLKSL